MKILFLSLFLLGYIATPVISEGDEDKIFIYNGERKVCSGRLDKCFPIAVGSNAYPTPSWDGPKFLTTHYKDGFVWQNPLTGEVFQPHQHNLGPIWIEIYNDNQTGWQYGFHATPEQHIDIGLQYSHGCLRMVMGDLREFSSSLEYLDRFYSL